MDSDEYDKYSLMWEQKQVKQQAKQAGKPKQPEYRPVIIENIPESIKQMKIWAGWKSVPNPDKDKPDKMPMSYQINPITGLEVVKLASCNKPETWMTFEDAVRLKKSNRAIKGFQVALFPTVPTDDEDRLIGVDIDRAFLSDGTIKPEYLEWIAKFNTYFELSPGNDIEGGLRGFCFGHFPTPGGKHQGDIEIYQNGKWLTITGQKLANSPATINTSQETIEAFRAQYFKTFNEIDGSNLPKSNKIFTDEEIINILKAHSVIGIKEDFNQFFYKGQKTSDHSSDDLSLCNLMRYYTQNIEQIDRIFRQSALMRDKWDEVHFGNGDTYGEGTIKISLNTRTRVYTETVRTPLPDVIDFEILNFDVGQFKIKSDGIFKQKVDKDGNEFLIRITSTPCVITAKGNNKDNGDLLYKVVIKGGSSTPKIVWRKGSGLFKKSGVLELLDFGLEFQEADSGEMNKFFFEFTNNYRDSLPLETVVSSSGWKDNYTQCVIGNKMVSTEGVFDIIQIENSAVAMYGQKGTAEAWAKDVDELMKFTPIRFKAYASFGCLILKKADIDNYIFDQCCGTTRLKSFSNRLVASMFGNPKKQQLSAKSTAIGIEKIAAACNDLPIFLDETSENVAFVMDLVYRFANSNTRVKSNTSSGLEISENFCSGLFLTGEDSIITETSKGGHSARRVPETHGVPNDSQGFPQFVIEETKTKINKSMKENYGNIAILFIQELLPIINDVESLYVDNFNKLPDTGTDAMAGRLKGYYTVILTAGQILERVFKKLGMTPAEPLEIVTSYFEENVMCGVSESDHIKMLRFVYDMYVSDKSHFGATAGSEWDETERIELNEKYGWIDIKDGVTIINFRPASVREHIIKSLGNKDGANRYETGVAQWGTTGISNTTKSIDSKTKKEKIVNRVQIRTANDDRQSAIQIPLENFYKYLKLEDDSKKPPIDNPEDGTGGDDAVPSVSAPAVAVAIPSPSSSGGFNQVLSVTAGIHENIIVYYGSSDLYSDLMDDLRDDD
jgi:uncharacterized protein (DUF927 family)